MHRARSAAAIVLVSLVLAACGGTSADEQPRAASSTTSDPPETTTSTSAPTTTTTTITNPAPLTQEQAAEHVASHRGPYGAWVPVADTYDPAATLSVIVGQTYLGTGSSPEQLFFFVEGQPVDVDVDPRSAIQVDHVEGDTVTASFIHYAPGDPTCCPSLPRYVVRFRWNGEQVELLDPYPPEGQGWPDD